MWRTGQITATRRVYSCACCILGGVEDLFDFDVLSVQQPAGLLPDRANYEIFDHRHTLLASAIETEGHARLKLLGKIPPDTRVLAVTTAQGEPLFSLVKHTSEWHTEFRAPDGALVGTIKASATRRNYTLVDADSRIVAQVTGDLGMKHFSAADETGRRYALVRKTWAGLTKEMFTPSDHYKVEFSGSVSSYTRTLTVMMPIVLDLTLYGPI